MRQLFWWPCLALLVLTGMSASGHDPDSYAANEPSGSPPGDGAPSDASSATLTTPSVKPQVIINGKKPSVERPLPTLPQDQYVGCAGKTPDVTKLILCQLELNQDRHIVFEACMNPNGTKAPDRVIQACTTLLDRKDISGRGRYWLFANRADAYFIRGDKQHALDDYDKALELAPNIANLHYNRGIFYVAQSDDEAALRDFDAALGIDSKLVPALRQRAKIYVAQGNFSGALADYSEAIRLQPKTAVLWSERGYVRLRQRDYDAAIKDEAQAVELDPKLARAYFLRGAAGALGGIGDRAEAVGDLKNGVRLDPSLDQYVKTSGKRAYLALPPL